MPIANITIDRGRQMGGDLLSIVESFRSLQDRLRQHKEMMGYLWNGTDYTQIELQYGVSTGKGAELLNMVNASVNYLNNVSLVALGDYQYAAGIFNEMIDKLMPVV